MRSTRLRHKFLHQVPLLLAMFFIFLAVNIHLNHEVPKPKVDMQQSAYNFDRGFLKFISFGNKRLLSSVLWIQTLMESDQEKYKKGDLGNWMFLRFLSIASLDPNFYENYLYGGMYLSVVKDDLEGAARIFELGLQRYPEDYSLNYYAGFNYFFEMGDMKKGYEILRRIEDHPRTPDSLRFVIGKLRFEATGNYDVAIAFLQESIELAKSDGIKKKLTQDLYALVAERDIQCLNSGKVACNLRDLNGDPYLQNADGTWKTQDPFKEYKIFRRKGD